MDWLSIHPIALFLLCCPFLAFLLLFAMDVRKGQRLRWLQNFVHRLYAFCYWLEAIAQGIDAGVTEYYRARNRRSNIQTKTARAFPPKITSVHKIPPQAQVKLPSTGTNRL